MTAWFLEFGLAGVVLLLSVAAVRERRAHARLVPVRVVVRPSRNATRLRG